MTIAFSQVPVDTKKIDSLKATLPTASLKDQYTNTLEITFLFNDANDHQNANQYAEQARKLALEVGDSAEIARSMRIHGQMLRRVDKLDDAIAVLEKALAIADRNNVVKEQKSILNALAVSHVYRADYDKALRNNFRSLEIREREGDPHEISIALNNIGIVYYKMSDYEQALRFYLRALETKKAANDSSILDQLHINIGLCYLRLRRIHEASEYINKGLAICGDNCATNIIIEGQFSLGYLAFEKGDYEQGLIHLNNSLEVARKVADKSFQTENMYYTGRIAFAKKEYADAVRIFNETIKMAESSGYNQTLINAYQQLYLLYTETNNLEKTSQYQLKYIQLKDSVYSEELIRNLARIQSDYEERENLKTIAEKNEILSLNQQVIQRQREVYFFVALVAVLSILGTFMFLRYSRALSRAKQELSVMNQTLEKRVEDRTKQLQNVNNELDNFIYKTSHDIRGPLASLKGIANVALLELKDAKAQDYLQKLDASADKLNSILTRLLIVNQINHAVLNPQKINFEELINEILVFEKKKGIPPRMNIIYQIDPDVLLITDRHVLRIILENLIDNAIKYHNSSERIEPFVKINVSLHAEGVQVMVIDNGIGIQERDPQKLFQMFVRASERSESGGIGLYLTKLASERLFARVDFSTTTEKYTKFTVTIPENLNKVIALKEKEDTTG